MEQLDCIARLCGTPNKENWPAVDQCRLYKDMKLKGKYPRRLKEHFTELQKNNQIE